MIKISWTCEQKARKVTWKASGDIDGLKKKAEELKETEEVKNGEVKVVVGDEIEIQLDLLKYAQNKYSDEFAWGYAQFVAATNLLMMETE